MYLHILRVKHTSLVVQGVVTYVSCRSICERDPNWIKRSKPFVRADQGIKLTSKLQKSTDQECTAAIWLLAHWKSSDQELQKHTFAEQKSWSQLQALLQVTLVTTPFVLRILSETTLKDGTCCIQNGRKSSNYYLLIQMCRLHSNPPFGLQKILYTI